MLTIANYDIAYVTDAEAINKYLAGRYMTAFTPRTAGEFENLTVIANKHVIWFNNAHGYSEFTVFFQHTVLTVYRNEEFRANQVEHGFQVFLATVTGYVNAAISTIDYIGTEAQ